MAKKAYNFMVMDSGTVITRVGNRKPIRHRSIREAIGRHKRHAEFIQSKDNSLHMDIAKDMIKLLKESEG